MREITIKQDMQPDGTIHHVSGLGCSFEPCAIVNKQGEVPGEICGYLFAKGMDEEGCLVWGCDKPVCQSGIVE